MPNPSYGDAYKDTLPTPFVLGYTSGSYTASDRVYVNTSGATFRFGLRSSSSYYVRVAYMRRERESANAGGWDGGETWTGWHNDSDVADTWEELYGGGILSTAFSTITGVPNLALASTWDVSVPWNTVNTYDAIEYRVQCWYIWQKGSVTYYGSPDEKIIRIEFAPTYTASAVASLADESLTVTMAISNWARGAEMYAIKTLAFSDGGLLKVSKSSADGTFRFPASQVADSIDSSTVTISGAAYPIGSLATYLYDVTASITVDGTSGSVTAPACAVTESDGAEHFKITDASYDGVTITVAWGDSSFEVECYKSGGYWYADIVPPFNVAASWKAAAYKVVGGSKLFNTTTGTFTLAGYGYELRADDGRHVTIVLEADAPLTTDTDTTVTTLASGRSVARHGNAIRRAWTLKGTLLGSSHSATSDWLDDLEILDEPRDLTFRSPYGEVKRVAVTGWQRSAPDIWDVVDVTVTMREVG